MMVQHERSLFAAAAALHSVDAEMAADVQAHAAECDDCGREFAEFRETAARLGSAAAEQPPAALRASVLHAISETRQLPPGSVADSLSAAAALDAPTPTQSPADELATRRTRKRWPLLIAAAVLAAAGIALGVTIGDRGPADDVAMTACVAKATDGRAAAPSPDSTGTGTVMIYPSCGGAKVQLADLPAVPSGKTYQLWVIAGSAARSVGMMTPDADGSMPTVMAPVHLGDTAIGLTVEPAGGSPAPTTDPVVVVKIA